MRAREVHLLRRPHGRPIASDFALLDVELADPAPGQVQVRNLLMSVDPGMRLRMGGDSSYLPAVELGHALPGAAVGVVEASRAAGFRAGDLVRSMLGWRDRFVADESSLEPFDRGDAPLSAHLGVLGATGLAAYIGINDVARARAGETVLVSGASGAVGSVAGQLARLRGCRVVGITRGVSRARHLTEALGFDAALDHGGPDLDRRLREACPTGVDVYFDNVGGPTLEAALGVMARFGRVVACGMATQYDAAEPAPGPRNLMRIVTERLTVRGFIVYDHPERRRAFLDEVVPLLESGELVAPVTIEKGLDAAVPAFLALGRGAHVGKLLVALNEEQEGLQSATNGC